MSMYYKTAIDVLSDIGVDGYRKIAFALARENPEMFCKLIGKSPLGVTALAIFKSEGMVAAIKAVRAETGWGLKESKDFVDDVVNKAGV